MTDIQELCDRVIIIDHGQIFFDGQLNEIVDRFADFKLITIQCDGAANCPADQLAKYGEVVEQDPGSITLKVKRDRVIPCLQSPARRTARKRHRHSRSAHRRSHPPDFCAVKIVSLSASNGERD